jgi:hypothetical protein
MPPVHAEKSCAQEKEALMTSRRSNSLWLLVTLGAFALLIAVQAASPASAATICWATSGANGNIDNTLNWDLGVLPTSDTTTDIMAFKYGT